MLAPLVYFLAWLDYLGVGLVFCIICLVLALVPRMRTVSLRAAGAMAATYPAVLLYQLGSLPFMAVLYVAGMMAVGAADPNKHPNSVIVFVGVLVAFFGGVSLAGFVSGWRIGWTALAERSLVAGLRRDVVVSVVRRSLRRTGRMVVAAPSPDAVGAAESVGQQPTKAPPAAR